MGDGTPVLLQELLTVNRFPPWFSHWLSFPNSVKGESSCKEEGLYKGDRDNIKQWGVNLVKVHCVHARNHQTIPISTKIV